MSIFPMLFQEVAPGRLEGSAIPLIGLYSGGHIGCDYNQTAQGYSNGRCK